MGFNGIKLGVGAMFLTSAFAMQNATADSYVFVTNTTPQTVTLQVTHTGSHILQHGNHVGAGSHTNCTI